MQFQKIYADSQFDVSPVFMSTIRYRSHARLQGGGFYQYEVTRWL
ncbi:hypothetical protein QFZ50_000823 [Arthrobacter agilis]|jgi:hypothetical protein|nr:hypothetical protein [Arthrobacter agilis]